MPLILEPIKELKQIEIQPTVTKVENSSVTSYELSFILAVVLLVFIFRQAIFGILKFIFKLSLIVFAVYCWYIIYIQ